MSQIETLERHARDLTERRASVRAAAEATIEAARRESRNLTAGEQADFDARYAQLRDIADDIDATNRRLIDAREAERRMAAVAASRAGTRPADLHGNRESVATIGREARTYARGDYRTSWTRDMFDVGAGRDAQGLAQERLARNSREIQVDLESRALSTGAGAGGEFAPPAWLISEFAALARAARPTASRVTNQPLPTGISSVNIPKLLTGTATGQQATQNTALQNTDATTTSITAAITTIAGLQSVSQQLLDQSGVAIDDILLGDLLADYAAKVDLLVLNNNVTNAKGLLQQAGTQSQTYTSASPTTKLLFAQIAAAANLVITSRFLPADTIVMHPRRWLSIVGASDASNRPLTSLVELSSQTNAVNSVALATDNAAQGVVGRIAGMDVVIDPQIPTTLGAGTNQDAIIVTRAADQILWEGTLKAEAFRDTRADQLAVLLRVYNYAAFTAARYPASTAIISGTGCAAPLFDGS